MPDLDALAGQIGAELAVQVKSMLTDMQRTMEARIEAASVRSALIDRDNELVLTYGDGHTERLGVVVGRDGHHGADGATGADGAQGPQGDPGLMGDPGPAGADGAQGEAGPAGAPGLPGEMGAQGPEGAAGPAGAATDLEPLAARVEALAGLVVRNAMIDHGGQLRLAYANGETITAGPVVGSDGKDGKDGADGAAGKDGAPGAPGLGFEDLDATVEADGRTLVLAFTRGETVRRFAVALPVTIYRGVFEPDRAYLPGDTVTFGGSMWVCNTATQDRPGEGVKTWTLAVKRGRDGKDFAGPQIKVAS